MKNVVNTYSSFALVNGEKQPMFKANNFFSIDDLPKPLHGPNLALESSKPKWNRGQNSVNLSRSLLSFFVGRPTLLNRLPVLKTAAWN